MRRKKGIKIYMARIPRNPTLREKWISSIAQYTPELQPGPNSVVCEVLRESLCSLIAQRSPMCAQPINYFAHPPKKSYGQNKFSYKNLFQHPHIGI